MIKFKTNKWDQTIKQIEIIRETEKCIIIFGWRSKEKRILKRSQYEDYFDTFDEAAKFKREQLMETLKGLKKVQERTEAKLIELNEFCASYESPDEKVAPLFDMEDAAAIASCQ